jgi:hypothetical protein
MTNKYIVSLLQLFMYLFCGNFPHYLCHCPLEFFFNLFALFAARKAINQQPYVLNYLDTGYFIANFSYPKLVFY